MNGLFPTHFALLEAKVNDSHFDAIAISETKINPLACDSHLVLDGFNFFHIDREGMGGGGVGLYVRDTYSVQVLANSEPRYDNTPEFIICEVRRNQLKLLLAVVYRRPHAAYPIHFFNCLANYLPHFPSVIITGDFNMNMALPDSPAALHLNNAINSNSLHLVYSEPTHHQPWRDSHTWIDLFLVKSDDRVLAYQKSPAPFIAGHDFIELTLACSKLPPVVKHVPMRNLKTVNLAELERHLTHQLSTSTVPPPFTPNTFIATSSHTELVLGPCSANVDRSEGALTKALLSAFDAVAPLRTIVLSSRRKPWVTPQIRALMKTRDRAYKIVCDSRTPTNLARFRALRSEVCNALDSAKNQHIASRLAEAPSAEAKWRELRRLGLSASNMPSPLLHFDAATLNGHYAAFLNRHPPATELDFEVAANSPRNPLLNCHFDFCPLTERDVLEVISKASSKAAGSDGISVPMLKLSSHCAITSLTNLFNSSLTQATFPMSWKKALVRPLAKVKALKLPSDTRPIAQLPEISKLLERLVHNQLQGYLEVNKLIHPRQAGFRPGHSTQTALLGVFDDIRQAIDDRMMTILVLFDFSKAFDSIPHALLLSKLKSLNISNRVLRWFFTYLTGRVQAVVDSGGSVSDWLRAASGVPQGSVLGPLLFAIFINDLPAAIRFAKIMIFADDTQLYLHFYPTNLLQAIENMNRDAQAVANWARANGLLLNEAKTKVIILGSLLYVTAIDLDTLPRITINGHALPYSTEARSLGVTFTHSLDWQLHAKEVTRKVYCTLYMLRFYKRALNRDNKKLLVESLILSRFDYACPVYHHLDITRTKKLETALNACVRFVVGYIPFRGHVTPHRLELGWLSAMRRREYFICLQAFNVIANAYPSYLTQRFNCRVAIDLDVRRSERNPPTAFAPPTTRTEAYKNAFACMAMSLLNSLRVVEFRPLLAQRFKRELRAALMQRDIADWNTRVQNERFHTSLLRPASAPIWPLHARL